MCVCVCVRARVRASAFLFGVDFFLGGAAWACQCTLECALVSLQHIAAPTHIYGDGERERCACVVMFWSWRDEMHRHRCIHSTHTNTHTHTPAKSRGMAARLHPQPTPRIHTIWPQEARCPRNTLLHPRNTLLQHIVALGERSPISSSLRPYPTSPTFFFCATVFFGATALAAGFVGAGFGVGLGAAFVGLGAGLGAAFVGLGAGLGAACVSASPPPASSTREQREKRG